MMPGLWSQASHSCMLNSQLYLLAPPPSPGHGGLGVVGGVVGDVVVLGLGPLVVVLVSGPPHLLGSSPYWGYNH